MKKVIVLALALVTVSGQKVMAMNGEPEAVLALQQQQREELADAMKRAQEIASQQQQNIQGAPAVAVPQQNRLVKAAKFLWRGTKGSFNAAGTAAQWVWNNKVTVGVALATVVAMQHSPDAKLKALVGGLFIRGLLKVAGFCRK